MKAITSTSGGKALLAFIAAAVVLYAIIVSVRLRMAMEVCAVRAEAIGLLRDATNRLTEQIADLKLERNVDPKYLNELLRLRGQVSAFVRDRAERGKAGGGAVVGSPVIGGGLSQTNQAEADLPRQSIPMSELKFVGYSTPEAGVQSAIASMRDGDFSQFWASLTPAARLEAAREFANLSDDERSQLLMRESAGLGGLRLDKATWVSDSEVSFVLASKQSDNGREITHDSTVISVQNVGGEWRLAHP